MCPCCKAASNELFSDLCVLRVLCVFVFNLRPVKKKKPRAGPEAQCKRFKGVFTDKMQRSRAELHLGFILLALILVIAAAAVFLRPQAAPRGVVVASFATSLRGR